MAAVSKILWLNGGIAQSIATADTVSADGVWTFTGSHMVLDGYIDASGFATDASGNVDASGYIHALGDLSVSNGKFVVDASGNFDASGNGQIDGTLSVDGVSIFGNDVTVNGDLTVNGTIISRGQVDVVIQDAFLDLSFGNSISGTSSVASSSGGFTVTQARNANFVAGNVTAFPSSTSFTYADATGSTLLAAGDVVAISGLPSEFAENDGFFVVASVNQAQFPQTVTIESSPASSLPWMQTALQDGTPASAGSAYKVNLSVLAIADGTSAFKSIAGATWPVGTLVLASYIGAQSNGATKALFQANGAYVAVGAGSTTLQNAYDNGNQIITSASRNVYITGSEALLVDASGGVDISGVDLTVLGGAVDVTLALGKDFAVDGNAQQEGYFYIGTGQPVAAYEMHAAGNSAESATNFDSIASAAYTLRATSGAMTVAGNSLALDASGSSAAITASTEISATAPRVLLDASGAQLDASNNALALDASASAVVTAPAILLDASGASIDASSNAVQIDASASILAQAPAIKLDASGAQLDASGDALALDASASIVATAPSILLDASGAQIDASSNALALDASASIIATAPQVKMDGSGAQIDAANNALALDASASIIAIAPAILLDASGASVDASNNALALDASGAIDLSAVSTSSFAVSSGDLNLSASAMVDVSGLRVLLDASGAQLDLSGNAAALDASASIVATAPRIALDASGVLIDASGNDLTIDASGAFNLSATSSSSIAIYNDLSISTTNSFLGLNGGTTASLSAVEQLTLTSSTRAIQLQADQGGVGIQVKNKAGSAAPKGSVLTVKSGANPAQAAVPEVTFATSDAANVSERRVFGIAADYSLTANNATGIVGSVPGTTVAVRFASAPISAQVGAPVFLDSSTNAGYATMTPPSTGGESVVQIGYLASAAADIDGNYNMIFAPQFIATIPA